VDCRATCAARVLFPHAELIAVIEDDENIRAVVAAGRTREGLRVRQFAEGTGLLAELLRDRRDLVGLDVMLPDTDGFSICRGIRGKRDLASLQTFGCQPRQPGRRVRTTA